VNGSLLLVSARAHTHTHTLTISGMSPNWILSSMVCSEDCLLRLVSNTHAHTHTHTHTLTHTHTHTHTGNLTYLKYLDLSANDLHSDIPVSLSHLSNLRVLNLGYNPNVYTHTHTHTHTHIHTHTHTHCLSHAQTRKKKKQLSGILTPYFYAHTTRLEELCLCYTDIAGDLSTTLTAFRSLTLLDVKGNPFFSSYLSDHSHSHTHSYTHIHSETAHALSLFDLVPQLRYLG